MQWVVFTTSEVMRQWALYSGSEIHGHTVLHMCNKSEGWSISLWCYTVTTCGTGLLHVCIEELVHSLNCDLFTPLIIQHNILSMWFVETGCQRLGGGSVIGSLQWLIKNNDASGCSDCKYGTDSLTLTASVELLENPSLSWFRYWNN